MTQQPGARRAPVLITGCSTGIGRAAAVALEDRGLVVWASARRVESVADLADRGLRTVALDVTSEESMVAAVRAVEAADGPVGTLVNNAGYGLYGAVEQVPLDEVRRQFETNVFGLVRLTQLVLPGMREARHGRIVNVSSMGGRTTLPGGAFYHASKHAVESLSDALRMELAQFGVSVVLIEPGPVRTPWTDVAAASVSASPVEDGPDPYAAWKAGVREAFGAATTGAIARFSSDPEDVGEVIADAVTARRPRTRYLVNPVARAMVALKAVLPDRAHDAVLRRQYGLPG